MFGKPIRPKPSYGVSLKTFHFTKSDRITNRSEFVNLSNNGQKLKNEHFIAAVRPGRSTITRLGITVTKKIGCAAIRNRIKRLTREYFRLNRHRIQGIWDINIIARKETSTISSKIAFSSLERLFDVLVREYKH
ncbi:MAG: ribonuclease P protein component [Deltaproteobacteria bacterium]|nr:MAG: ribonuclease P protein component [Deltaproteobacteria bacterium]